MAEHYTADEMMTIAAARMVRNGAALLRRHRAAERGGEPRAADARARHGADLRVGHDRHEAERAAAVDRRRRAGRDRRRRRVGAGDVRLLAAGRAASISAFSAPRRSIASPTSTPP